MNKPKHKKESTFAKWELTFASKLHLAEIQYLKFFNIKHLTEIFFADALVFLFFFFRYSFFSLSFYLLCENSISPLLSFIM